MNSDGIVQITQEVVTILKGNKSRDLERNEFKEFVLEQMIHMPQSDKINKFKTYYINAFEWLYWNLYRASGIQLYNDREVRINIDWSVEGEKKCVFLSEANISDTKFDDIIYDELERLLVCGL